METRQNVYLSTKRKRKRSAFLGVGIGMLLVLFSLASLSMIFSEDVSSIQGKPANPVPINVDTPAAAADSGDGLWDGPVLYHHPANQPIHLILVEKAEQKLHLYRYDGAYRLITSYFCATGEKKGKKREEKDERTPEGIYFNDRTYRDRKVTVFGDRAFGLNYPDAFDDIAGNRGSGIFIHGSNRQVSANSTNGCLVMDNADIADLDSRVDLKETPVIIGRHLPYRFGVAKRNLTELIPFLKQAFVPEAHAGSKAAFDGLTVIGFEERVVAVSRVRISAGHEIVGTSRLYLAGPGDRLLVLLRREWQEEKTVVADATPATPAAPAVPQTAEKKAVPAEPPVLAKKPPAVETAAPAPNEKAVVQAAVESWRQAWQQKRLNDYIAHYHPGFTNKGRNLLEWKDYKGRLNRQYRQIAVYLSDFSARVDGNSARAYFRQRYRSDQFRSNSYKILELRKSGGQWKIYREDSFSNKPSDWPA